jgi:hypothetical protein
MCLIKIVSMQMAETKLTTFKNFRTTGKYAQIRIQNAKAQRTHLETVCTQLRTLFTQAEAVYAAVRTVYAPLRTVYDLVRTV